jgi:hypothetical protein
VDLQPELVKINSANLVFEMVEDNEVIEIEDWISPSTDDVVLIYTGGTHTCENV